MRNTRSYPHALFTALLAVTLAGCATAHTPPAHTPTTEPVAVRPPAPVTVEAVGDSITAWTEYDGTFRDSWVSHLPERIRFAGGWAKGGAPTSEMVANTPALHADAAVILAGTNDVAGFPNGVVPTDQILANISTIAAQTGADSIYVIALGPSNNYTAQNNAFNPILRAYAAAQGWHFIDPWTTARNADGTYNPALTIDGVHPTPALSATLGAEIGAAVLAGRK